MNETIRGALSMNELYHSISKAEAREHLMPGKAIYTSKDMGMIYLYN
jgi:hypothetical protein